MTNKPTPHYVKSYEAMVSGMRRTMSLHDAMSAAVGGDYDAIGAIERSILDYAGLAPGMSVIDVGCGSGRLASKLAGWSGHYLGVDIVQALLDYAATRSPPSFRFVLSTDLRIPASDASADLVCFFSVLTHLTQLEGYRYLLEAIRVLKPGGSIVVSVLELAEPDTWTVFAATAKSEQEGTLAHMNTFTERPMIEAIATRHGLDVTAFVAPNAAPWGGAPLGQSVALLRKR